MFDGVMKNSRQVVLWVGWDQRLASSITATMRESADISDKMYYPTFNPSVRFNLFQPSQDRMGFKPEP